MKGFPFKRHLVILGACMLIIGAMVPLATFAKSASGEPHRPLIPSTVTRHSDLSTGQITTDVTSDAPCSSPTIGNSNPFNAGDLVVVVAKLVDVNDPNEVTENEHLHVFDTGGAFDKTVNVDTGFHVFPAFTATASDTLEACIAGDGPDGDEQGTVTFTVTPAPQIDLLGPNQPPSAIFRGGPAQPNPRVMKVVQCLVDIFPVGKLVKVLGFAGHVFKVIQVVFSTGTTIIAIVQDVKTGQLLSVPIEVLKALVPGESCFELIHDLTPIRPVS